MEAEKSIGGRYLGGEMYGVSRGRDAGEWSEEEKKKGQRKKLKKQKENKGG